MPECGRVLGLIDVGPEVVDVLHRHLVIKGDPDKLERVGPDLQTFLQSLINLREVFVQRKLLLPRDRCDGESSGDGMLAGEGIYRTSLEDDPVVGEEDCPLSWEQDSTSCKMKIFLTELLNIGLAGVLPGPAPQYSSRPSGRR